MDNQQYKSSARPLPTVMPEYIMVEIHKSAFKGRDQWVATYKLYNNGHPSDTIDIVVNFKDWFQADPQEWSWWWIKPANMAPHMRLIFADAVSPITHHQAPLTVRTGDELILSFDRSTEEKNKYVARHDGWQFFMWERRLMDNESWRVRVRHIHLDTGMISVDPIGPAPKATCRLPEKVGYIAVTPLYGDGEVIENETLTYSRHYSGNQGECFRLQLEHKAKIISLQCSMLRQYGKEVIGYVCPIGGDPYLAKVEFLEGEPLGLPIVREFRPEPFAPAPRRHSNRRRFDSFWEEENDRDFQDYLAECRENEERPDYD